MMWCLLLVALAPDLKGSNEGTKNIGRIGIKNKKQMKTDENICACEKQKKCHTQNRSLQLISKNEAQGVPWKK